MAFYFYGVGWRLFWEFVSVFIGSGGLLVFL